MPVGEYIHHPQLWSASNHFGSKSFHMPSLCERENEWETKKERERDQGGRENAGYQQSLHVFNQSAVN